LRYRSYKGIDELGTILKEKGISQQEEQDTDDYTLNPPPVCRAFRWRRVKGMSAVPAE